jgi:nucleoside-diphosphate-sugar epimerase
MKHRVLVTGASGFVGKALIQRLVADKLFFVRAAFREKRGFNHDSFEYKITGEMTPDSEWDECLRDVDVVIHLAARAHILNDASCNPLFEFMKTNFYTTEKLALQASKLGVKRFIFLSTVGVNGAHTLEDEYFSEGTQPNPHNYYSLSKWEAEKSLFRIAQSSAMDIVVIRAPLVYGVEAPGNFALLLKAVYLGLPMPLKSIRNDRSIIALSNLVDFIVLTIDHPNAANQIFMVCDEGDISTTNILKLLAAGMKKKLRLFYAPQFFVKTFAFLLGIYNSYKQLSCSLRIDSSKSSLLLNWTPRVSTSQALQKVGEDYVEGRNLSP